MRLSTRSKPVYSVDYASRIGNGRDFEVYEKIDSAVSDSGLLIFGSTASQEFETEPTKIELAWNHKNKELRMKYMLETGAKGILLSGFDETTLPEKTFLADKPLGGFEFITDNGGSSFLFGQFTNVDTAPEIFVETGLSDMEKVDATRLVNFHLDRLMSGLLRPILQKS